MVKEKSCFEYKKISHCKYMIRCTNEDLTNFVKYSGGAVQKHESGELELYFSDTYSNLIVDRSDPNNIKFRLTVNAKNEYTVLDAIDPLSDFEFGILKILLYQLCDDWKTIDDMKWSYI